MPVACGVEEINEATVRRVQKALLMVSTKEMRCQAIGHHSITRWLDAFCSYIAQKTNEKHNCKDCGWLDRHGCQCPKLCERDCAPPGDDSLVYCYNEGGGFDPQPNFGCVHFKPRECGEGHGATCTSHGGNGERI